MSPKFVESVEIVSVNQPPVWDKSILPYMSKFTMLLRQDHDQCQNIILPLRPNRRQDWASDRAVSMAWRSTVSWNQRVKLAL